MNIHQPPLDNALTLLSAVGMRQVVLALAPVFEQETGRRLAVAVGSGPEIGQRVKAGEYADVVVIPRQAIDALIGSGKVRPSHVLDVAWSVVGLAIRADASSPNISSLEALKATLLSARSIARPDPTKGGSSGLFIERLFETLGISEDLRPRTLLATNPDREDEMPGTFVASGRAELALHQMQELKAVPGITVVGPLPDVLRGSSQEPDSLRLLELLGRRETQAIIEAKGMWPVR
jgi:molybdate transport system substrate-binding protein